MENESIIEKSTCEWASPVVLVGKNDGTMRMYINFQRLNKVTPMDAYIHELKFQCEFVYK